MLSSCEGNTEKLWCKMRLGLQRQQPPQRPRGTPCLALLFHQGEQVNSKGLHGVSTGVDPHQFHTFPQRLSKTSEANSCEQPLDGGQHMPESFGHISIISLTLP